MISERLQLIKRLKKGSVKGKPCRRHAPHRFSGIASHSPLATFLLASCLLTGCAYIESHGSTPSRKPTAIEQVMVFNANLADANLAIAKGVIAATESGSIDVSTANALLTEQSKIADADRQLTPILAKACSPQQAIQACNPAILSADATTIRSFLDQIQTSGANLATSGLLGIKNAQTAASIKTAITAINTLVKQITGGLQALGILK